MQPLDGHAMPERVRILLVEDNAADADFVRELLSEEHASKAELTHVERVADALSKLEAGPFDVVLLDLSLPDAYGLEGLRRLRVAVPGMPVVVLTSSVDQRLGLRAVAEGAQDYLLKGEAAGSLLLRAIRYGIERQHFISRLHTIAQEREQALLAAESAMLREQEANRAKDEFLAVVSHELRTPLTSILGWAQLLLAKKLPEARRDRAMQVIERNAREQSQLINDLLDVSRITTGQLRLNVGAVDMLLVVERALEVTRLAAEVGGIELITMLDSDAPPLRGDADRLQQVIWNLVTNAIKFSARGGKVTIALRHHSSQLELEVSDTGMGIAREFLPHVFEPFRQADATSLREHGGLGLGLSIVRHLVELHGGKVEARSEGQGKGAAFLIRLPLSGLSVVPTAAVERSRLPEEDDGLQDLRGTCVLVVEDQEDSREMLALALESYNARVLTAGSFQEALRVLDAEHPNVILLDIGLPGKDGFELISEIRRRSPEKGGKTPAAAISAYDRAEDRTRALTAGFDRYLSKPIQASELAALVAGLAGVGAPANDVDAVRIHAHGST